MKTVKAFAPATVANVCCGFDILGFSVDSPGDEVILTEKNEPGVVVKIVTRGVVVREKPSKLVEECHGAADRVLGRHRRRVGAGDAVAAELETVAVARRKGGVATGLDHLVWQQTVVPGPRVLHEAGLLRVD